MNGPDASWVPVARFWVTAGTLGGFGLLWWFARHVGRELREGRHV